MNKKLKGFTLVEITITVSIITLITLIAITILNQARVSGRDGRRISNIKEIQTALELYYNRYSSYPTLITPGQTFSAENKIYIDPVPTNPLPRNDGNCGDNEYTYSVLADNSDYELNFCLGKKNNKTTQGANAASKNGINILPGLIGWWKFEEGSGLEVYDVTGNNNSCYNDNTGQKVNLSWGNLNDCKTGLCLKVNGSDQSYVDCGVNNDFIVNNGSISLWFNYKAEFYVEENHNILQIHDSDESDYVGLRLTGSNRANLIAYTGGIEKINLLTSAISTEKWYYLVATWDVNGTHLYINGPNINEDISSAGNKTLSLTTEETKLLIGAFLNQTNNHWRGYIDDVRVYNRALSSSEIQAIYDSLK